MLKQKWLLFLASTMTLAVLSACEEEATPAEPAEEQAEETVEAEESTEEEAEEEAETEEQVEAESNHGSRSNPVPLGESVQFTVRIDDYNDEDFEAEDGLLELSISNVVSGDEAWAMLQEENQFNEEAPDGYQWIIFDVQGTLVEGNQDVAYSPLSIISTVSESGAESPDGHYASIDNEFGYTDLFDGGTTTGRQVTIAPEDEDFLIKWREGFTTDVFFDVE